ncbi:MAG: class I SAM-dependent methyltransferase [Chitinophagaceae bacterium]|nr:class I SAM-dependent methyltransferase [Chitinophagaceae bacterium]
MTSQVNYYNQFGNLYRQSILDCPEPQYWTTDYGVKGRVYREMKERIDLQEKLVQEYFTKEQTVLDIGCGFGRQAFSLVSKGYKVKGTDTSDVFIEIAQQLFLRHGYAGDFTCMDILRENISGSFNQLLLLDVLEHIKPQQRRGLFEKLDKIGGTTLIISLPHVKKRVSSQLNNRIRKQMTRYLPFFVNREEHPYPIPGKNNMLKLSKDIFSLHKFIQTLQTDYYVFRR